MNRLKFVLLTILVSLPSISAWSASATDEQLAFRELYRELVEINTTLSVGSGRFATAGETNAHGLNEKIRVQSLYESREFLDRLIKIYVGRE